MAEEKQTLQDHLLSPKLQKAYKKLVDTPLYLRKGTDNKLSERIARSLIVKTVANVLKAPQSVKADVCLDMAKKSLEKYCFAKSNRNVYAEVVVFLLDALIEKKADKACLNKLAQQIAQEYKTNPPQNLNESIVLYNCAVKSGNKSLFENSTFYEVYVDEATFELYEKGIDYKSFFEAFRNSGVKKIRMADLPSEVNEEHLRGVLSGHKSLEKIETCEKKGFCDRELSADVFTNNPELKELDLRGYRLKDAEKVLKNLPKLERLEIRTRDTEAFYEALKTFKPACLEYVDYGEDNDEKRITLMKMYPDLCVKAGIFHSGKVSNLEVRNTAVIKAKKSKSAEDIKYVICHEALIEYLSLMDQKDRPTFEILNEKTGLLQGFRSSCFEAISWLDDYKEVFNRVYELCDFSDCADRANLFKAIQFKELEVYLKEMPAEQRPSLKHFFEPVAKGGETFLELIKRTYRSESEDAMKKILEFCECSSEDLAQLAKDFKFEGVAKEYELKKRYKENAKAAKSAFEKWKEEHPKDYELEVIANQEAAKKKQEEDANATKLAFEKWKEEHQKGE